MARRGMLLVAAAAAGLWLVVGSMLTLGLLMLGGLGGLGGVCTGPGGAPTPGGGSPGGGPALNGGDQRAYAQLITSIVAGRGLPQQAAVVAIAAAAQESRLGQAGMNTAVDHDSLGLFQQRPSTGWGSPTQVKDPTYATNAFLDALVEVGGWAAMPITKAAQTVQRSAFPEAYAKWEQQARRYAAQFWPPAAPPGGNPAAQAANAPPAGSSAAVQASAAGAAPCPGMGGDGLAPGQGHGQTALPPGYRPPAAPQQAAVVNHALAHLGDPYQWGGNGPDAWDCSGLMVAAWRQAGVTLPRTAAAQSDFGAPVPGLAAAQPGDLVFLAGSGGTPDQPGHVGMYIGQGQIINAPQQGQPVQIIPAPNWNGEITAIRRPGISTPDAPAPTGATGAGTNSAEAA